VREGTFSSELLEAAGATRRFQGEDHQLYQFLRYTPRDFTSNTSLQGWSGKKRIGGDMGTNQCSAQTSSLNSSSGYLKSNGYPGLIQPVARSIKSSKNLANRTNEGK